MWKDRTEAFLSLLPSSPADCSDETETEKWEGTEKKRAWVESQEEEEEEEREPLSSDRGEIEFPSPLRRSPSRLIFIPPTPHIFAKKQVDFLKHMA